MLLQTLEPEHWIPPAWLQPGTHWPVSQTWVGAPQAASFEQGPARGWQRPVLELHTSPMPQLRPPGRLQPGVQRPDSQTLDGAPQLLSLAQGGGGSQRPLALQTFPPEQAVPPGSAQPGTHWLFSQIPVGERHSGSELQRFMGASQRPVVVLQVSPPVHWTTEPMLAQPGTQALFSHTCPPPPQSGSALQPLGVGEGLIVGVGEGVGVGSLSLHRPKSQYWLAPHSSSAAQLIFRFVLSAWHCPLTHSSPVAQSWAEVHAPTARSPPHPSKSDPSASTVTTSKRQFIAALPSRFFPHSPIGSTSQGVSPWRPLFGRGFGEMGRSPRLKLWAAQVLLALLGLLAAVNGLVRVVGGGSPHLLSPLFLEEKLIALGRLGLHVAQHPFKDCPEPTEAMLAARAKEARIPADLVLAIAEVESNLASHRISSAGAMGLMQIMPATADRLRLGDPFDAKESGAAGTRFLAELWARYRGDRPRVIAAYNVGPGAVPVSGSYTLPRETRIYVERVQRANHRGQTSP